MNARRLFLSVRRHNVHTRTTRGRHAWKHVEIEHVRIHVHRRQDFVLGATPVDSNRRSYLIIRDGVNKKQLLAVAIFYRNRIDRAYVVISFFLQRSTINFAKDKRRRQLRKYRLVCQGWPRDKEYFQPRFTSLVFKNIRTACNRLYLSLLQVDLILKRF